LNLGCPQESAEVGKFGAYLAIDQARTRACVDELCKLPIPIATKIRVDESPCLTESLVQHLIDARIAMIAVHGRTLSNGRNGAADWDAIGAVVEMASRAAAPLPVLSNGGVARADQIDEALAYTGAAGLMSAEPLLVDPLLFAKWARHALPAAHRRSVPSLCVPQVVVAQQYLRLAIERRSTALDSDWRVARDHLLHMLGLRQRSRAVFKHTSRFLWRQYIINNRSGKSNNSDDDSCSAKAKIVAATSFDELSVGVEELAELYNSSESNYLVCDCCCDDYDNDDDREKRRRTH
jgi:tRNA-dihydrouridine synthase